MNLKKMSYLSLDKTVLIFFLVINIFFYTSTILRIENSQIYFSIFSLISIINISRLFYYRSSFFEKFFYFYIWLGYFFLYCIHQIYFGHQYNFPIGSFNTADPSHQKELFTVLIFANLGFLIASIFSSKYIFNFNEYSQKKLKLNNFFKKNFIFIIFITVLIISFININFKLFDYYYFANSRFVPLIDLSLKWFFLFGFSSILCIFLNLEISKNFIIKLFIVSSIQEFLFFFSILSRGCIFNSMAILFALYIRNKNELKFLKSYHFRNFLILIIVLFLTNFYLLIEHRSGSNIINYEKFRSKLNYIENLYDKKIIKYNSIYIHEFSEIKQNIIQINLKNENNVEFTKKKFFYIFDDAKISQIIFSIKNRIFGVDSLMSIVAYDKKSFDLFKSGLQEQFTPGKLSFFDKIRNDKSIFSKDEKSINLTLPSLIGFLYYTGSISFVLISCFSIVIFFNLFEKINSILNRNIFLCSLLGQLIAYRLWHFGYAPFNSYKFFLGILISAFMVFLFQKILLNINILKK